MSHHNFAASPAISENKTLVKGQLQLKDDKEQQIGFMLSTPADFII